ncbi:MAG TPA: TIGR04290 family methyltransferase [Pyrinomonadaceae bacterium]|nr:TIGR04290 family methyltransferase [Pyrinomonadaceae bacterium]
MENRTFSTDQIRRRVEELGQWFHNLDLHGVKTAPDHFLGDYPNIKWQGFANALPKDLSGQTVLDVGCNAGFYSIQMKLRGADRVVAVDTNDSYLAQARFAAEVSGVEIEFHHLSVYQLRQLREKFDLVLFLGVLYHLRHPLLALDLLHEHTVKDVLVIQSMLRGSESVADVKSDYEFWEQQIFHDGRFPQMYFVEQRFSGDPTNWWIPNRACLESMLRSAGFEILAHPEKEVFVCRWTEHNGVINPADELKEIQID